VTSAGEGDAAPLQVGDANAAKLAILFINNRFYMANKYSYLSMRDICRRGRCCAPTSGRRQRSQIGYSLHKITVSTWQTSTLIFPCVTSAGEGDAAPLQVEDANAAKLAILCVIYGTAILISFGIILAHCCMARPATASSSSLSSSSPPPPSSSGAY